MLGITEPSDQIVEIPAASRGGSFVPLNRENIPFKPRVIGIVKDFHFQSLRDKIEPLVLAYNNNPIHVIDYYSARIEAKDIQGTLDKLKTVMVNNDKDDPFEYHFLDDQLALFYVEDERRQTLLDLGGIGNYFYCLFGFVWFGNLFCGTKSKRNRSKKSIGSNCGQPCFIVIKRFFETGFNCQWYCFSDCMVGNQ